MIIDDDTLRARRTHDFSFVLGSVLSLSSNIRFPAMCLVARGEGSILTRSLCERLFHIFRAHSSHAFVSTMILRQDNINHRMSL